MTICIKPTSARFREVGTAEWLPAQVPGGVHTDLMALDKIPDPFVADNELAVTWVLERDWEYEVILDASAEVLAQDKVFLVCDGLDTLAEVKLNGQFLDETDNMFRQYRWDVRESLKQGKNVLHVVFRSTVNYIQEKHAELPLRDVAQAIHGGPYVRKAPSQFGWDWGPQLPPIGFWKEVYLEGVSIARFDDVFISQKHENGDVWLNAAFDLDRYQQGDITARLTLTAPNGRTQEAMTTLETDSDFLSIKVANPKLWWPNGLGAQPLYTVEMVLSQDGKIVDSRAYKVGLRTIELRQEPDEFGKSFTFVVNGVPIFAKGANWIPADSFPTRISDDLLETLISSAVAANMNMLRVWGGGFYEEKRFYDLCDQHGILVWQDFVFACSVYPDGEDFFDNVRVEAVQNIRRLRHRASLALWCGNNEMEGGWAGWGWRERQEQAPRFKLAYDQMFHRMLPDICAAEDPDRPYWPSSPSSGVPFDDPNSVHAGDTHNWEVWHGGRPFSHYRNHPSRFVSEFGFQSLPALDTVRTYANKADWNMTSYIMEHHQRNASGNGKIINYMTDHFRLPKDFESLVYLTQILQAEAVRYGVEFWRRNKRCTSGTLYWQLNDCWPVASWASLDYYGRWKALHYMARNFYAPVLFSAEEQGTDIKLFATSDVLEDWVGTARWSLETVSGEVLDKGQVAVSLPALSVVELCALDFAESVNDANRREVVFVYELWKDGVQISGGIVPFIATKHLALEAPGLSVAVTKAGDNFKISVMAQKLARFVWLELGDTIFSDNYFDLPAGRTVTVQMPASKGWTAAKIQQALKIRSLVDSY